MWVIGVPVRSSAGRALLDVAYGLLAAICPVKGKWGRGEPPERVLSRFLLECKATWDHKRMTLLWVKTLLPTPGKEQGPLSVVFAASAALRVIV